MMTGEKWKEGLLEGDGMFHTRAEGWDVEAFLIFMRIIHLQNRQVPKVVDLELLAKFAVIVDFYECEEAVEVWTDGWIKLITSSSLVPQTYGRDVILWICIARVFGLKEQFKKSTEVVVKRADETVRTLGLPIWVAGI
jgi:hypothetical protein